MPECMHGLEVAQGPSWSLMFPDIRYRTRKERLSLEGPKPLLDMCGDKAQWNFLLSVQHHQHHLFQVVTRCNEGTW